MSRTKQFRYQLTEWMDAPELDSIVDDLDAGGSVEGKDYVMSFYDDVRDKGWIVPLRPEGKWAVYTTGDSARKDLEARKKALEQRLRDTDYSINNINLRGDLE